MFPCVVNDNLALPSHHEEVSKVTHPLVDPHPENAAGL